MKNAIIVIGAGAAGLMAAYTLIKAGKKVTVLEARNRTGGRINTLYDASFFKKAELGAEFIHGNLPLTLSLLKEAGIANQPAPLNMWRYQNGRFKQEEEQTDGWDILMQKLGELKQDIAIAGFLDQHFHEPKYNELKRSVKQFVAGYDTADPAKASALALRTEWQNEDDDAQHRIDDGYCALISYLAAQIKAAGNEIELNAVVKHIHWQASQVRIITTDDATYTASRAIIALPLGILQLDKHEHGAIDFHPPLPGQEAAMHQIGFGAIIKILLHFDKPFWEDTEEGLKDAAFLFTEEAIPTWWTQGNGNSLLTGWLGGNAAYEWKDKPEEEIGQLALQALAKLFKLDTAVLKGRLIARHIANWTADPYTRGSYAYDMVGSEDARQLLNQPVNDTLLFAGEYLYSGPAMGTVEAALNSGEAAARRLL